MVDEPVRLIAGALLLGVAALVLLATLLPAVELPATAFALVVIGLFGGVYLVGTSRPGRAA